MCSTAKEEQSIVKHMQVQVLLALKTTWWFAVSLSLRIPISCATSHLHSVFSNNYMTNLPGKRKAFVAPSHFPLYRCIAVYVKILKMLKILVLMAGSVSITQPNDGCRILFPDMKQPFGEPAPWVASSHWVKRDKRCHPPYSQSSPETHRKRRHIHRHYSFLKATTAPPKILGFHELPASPNPSINWCDEILFHCGRVTFGVAASKDHNAFPLRYVIAGKLFNLSPNQPIWSIRTRSTTKHVDAAVFGWAVFCFLPGPAFQVWWSAGAKTKSNIYIYISYMEGRSHLFPIQCGGNYFL